jgi:hypothetical protein
MNQAPESPIQVHRRIYRDLTPSHIWRRLLNFLDDPRYTVEYVDVRITSGAYGNFVHWMANHKKRESAK